MVNHFTVFLNKCVLAFKRDNHLETSSSVKQMPWYCLCHEYRVFRWLSLIHYIHARHTDGRVMEVLRIMRLRLNCWLWMVLFVITARPAQHSDHRPPDPAERTPGWVPGVMHRGEHSFTNQIAHNSLIITIFWHASLLNLNNFIKLFNLTCAFLVNQNLFVGQFVIT